MALNQQYDSEGDKETTNRLAGLGTQKHRGFLIEVVAEFPLNVRTSITLPTHKFTLNLYIQHIGIFNICFSKFLYLNCAKLGAAASNYTQIRATKWHSAHIKPLQPSNCPKTFI
jgi:hypothetical protein